MDSSKIRQAFLDFFASKGHTVCPSASVIPNDPTLMFTVAGMVPFKDIFLGKETRAYTRAASSQKCIRISGKQNDLENVGQTARHHTFFEMLGNFSFGDYFKEDAIAFAWELLTQVYDLPKDRLIFTVFKGDDEVPGDAEGAAIWKKITGYGDERVVGMPASDNFWQAGDTGPCGPCSEIHMWLGPLEDGTIPYHRFGEEPTPEGHGWFEIWNLVFMQFDRALVDGKYVLTPLPKPSIDTGMGLERIASVLQGKTSNYETDLLRPLVDHAARLAGKPYGGSQSPDDVSMRVIADHARMATVSIAEGIFPDKNERPYVLRRVIRRAVRHGHRLGIHRPFLHEVAGTVIGLLGGHYPELREKRAVIVANLEQEEVRFRETMDRGMVLLEEQIALLKPGGTLPGKAIAKLYDTYGFPADLTEVIVGERGMKADMDGFAKAMEEIALISAGGTLNKDVAATKELYDTLEKVPGKSVKFLGYDREQGEATVVALLVDGHEVQQVGWDGGTGPLPMVSVITDATPFYGRSGGQEGDSGQISVLDGSGSGSSDGKASRGRVLISNTLKPVNGLFVHEGSLAQGTIKVGDRVELEVDHVRRSATRRNHSATHLLHWALGHVLGEHVEQKGSLVAPDTLRFDFSHNKPLTDGEIERIEDLVNERVLVNAPARTEVLPIAEARKRGARALFGEKYGDEVRVLTLTDDSVELCGGTHVHATGDIGLFKIVSEAGVAAGVRRIEAVTGTNALQFLRDQEKLLREIAVATKATSARPRVESIRALSDKVRELEKEKADLQRKVAMGGAGGGFDQTLAGAKDVGGVKVLAIKSDVSEAATMRELAEKARDTMGPTSVVLVAAADGGKVSLVVMVSQGLTSKIKAGDVIKPVAQVVGGKGGGRPDMAQAGGSDVGKLDEAIEAFYAKVAAVLGG